jgi:hypothetical protein
LTNTQEDEAIVINRSGRSDTVIADALTGFQSPPLTTAGRDKENVDVSLQVSDGRVLEMAVPELNSGCSLHSPHGARPTRAPIQSSSRAPTPEF